ncbi:MAG: type IX secretion system membrane protein PorP/SprF [Bacteroidia bacterium]
MRKRRHPILIFLLAVSLMPAKAQDPHFTQFYANPIYTNPAFTGATFQHRFVLNYRDQWPGIKETYKTFAVSYDYNMTEIHSGVGIQLLRDRAGTSQLTTTGFNLSYAYYYSIRKFRDIRLGLQLGYINQYYDYSKLVFNDQLYTGSSTSTDQEATSRINYVNVNAGGLYTTPYLWIGAAVHNLGTPNSSLVDGFNPLPRTWSVHGGYKFVVSKKGNYLEKYFAPALHYHHQQKFDQLDIGAYYFYAPFSLGVWYRGLPLKHYEPGYPNADAMAFLIGMDIKDSDLKIGISYDVTLSRLATKSFGAAELSIIYEIAKKSKKKRIYVSCPKF